MGIEEAQDHVGDAGAGAAGADALHIDAGAFEEEEGFVGKPFRLGEPGLGTCGKNGQGVPVGVGQPTLRMDRITVGGTG